MSPGETFLEQQFNDLLLALNQDNQGEYFNCQEKCNTLTEIYIFSTSCKSNIWVLPLTTYTQQTLDHKKTFSPPQLEIDLLLDSAATLNVLIMTLGMKLKNTTILLLHSFSNTKFNFLGTIFLEKNVDSVKCLSHTH